MGSHARSLTNEVAHEWMFVRILFQSTEISGTLSMHATSLPAVRQCTDRERSFGRFSKNYSSCKANHAQNTTLWLQLPYRSPINCTVAAALGPSFAHPPCNQTTSGIRSVQHYRGVSLRACQPPAHPDVSHDHVDIVAK